MPRIFRSTIALCAGLLLSWLATSTAVADSALSQSFQTSDQNLTTGSLVVLTGNPQTIQAATSDQASYLVGVIADKPLINIGNVSQAQVVLSGQTVTLVSDINGSIKAGDKITASPISGVGMKATVSTQVVGSAIDDFDINQAAIHTITDKSGEAHQIHVGTVAVQIDVSYYAISQDGVNNFVPLFLVDAGNAIAGKSVSPLRIFIGFAVLLIGFVVACIILYSAVRSGIISLGRNPLAHKVLRRGLTDVLITVVGLLIIAVIVFYLTLTL